MNSSIEPNKLGIVPKLAAAAGVFIIFVIILYFSFRSSPSSPEKVVEVTCELFPRCNFIKNSLNKEEIDELNNKNPSLNISNDTLNVNSIYIKDTDYVNFNDTIIRSVKSEGYDLILYPLPNFSGTPIKKTGKIYIDCGEVIIRSVIINRTK
jgi:hypothetical protein